MNWVNVKEHKVGEHREASAEKDGTKGCNNMGRSTWRPTPYPAGGLV